MTSPAPYTPVQTPHPPLGWSHFPTTEELEAQNRPQSPGVLSSIAGTIRTRTRSILVPGHPDLPHLRQADSGKVQSPMHPVQLTEIAVPTQPSGEADDDRSRGYYAGKDYGLPLGKTGYGGSTVSIPSSSGGRHVQFGDDVRLPSQSSLASSSPPEPPPHSARETVLLPERLPEESATRDRFRRNRRRRRGRCPRRSASAPARHCLQGLFQPAGEGLH